MSKREIQVAQNFPISNTGRVPPLTRPHGGKDIVIPVYQSALLLPESYDIAVQVPRPWPSDWGPSTSRTDRALQHFNVKVLPERIPSDHAQFSVLVNLTDLVPINK